MRRALRETVGGGAFAIAVGAAAGVTILAQDPLPDGPGKEHVVNICSKCHEPQRVAALRLTREGWEEEIAKMVTSARRRAKAS